MLTTLLQSWTTVYVQAVVDIFCGSRNIPHVPIAQTISPLHKGYLKEHDKVLDDPMPIIR